MTKAEEFDKARRLAYKGDFSLVEKLYDPNCKHFDHRAGMEVNLDTQNAIMSAYENSIFGPFRVIYENEEFVCIHRYSRVANADVFNSVKTAIKYKNGKVVNQQTVREELDYDPSAGQDWSWEDYE